MRNIYYLCPCIDAPCGGIQKIYQHVDVLNKNGFSAFVLHSEKGYRYAWRDNQTKLAYLESKNSKARIIKESLAQKLWKRFKKPTTHVLPHLFWGLLDQNPDLYVLESADSKVYLPKLNQQDAIVFNDYIVPAFRSLVGKYPSVILNFTAYTTFHGMSMEEALDKRVFLPYDQRCLACIIGSADTENYLRFTFPKVDYFMCPFGVETEQFVFHHKKEKKIAFMPRKCSEHLVQVISILKQRNLFPDWSFVSLEKISQEQLIRELQSTAIFLSSSYLEGFGLPPAEAMSCGAQVVGYDGEGGSEFFLPPFSHAIPHGKIIDFVKKTEELMASFEKDPERFVQIGKMGSDYIASKYPMEKEDRSIVETWNHIASAKILN